MSPGYFVTGTDTECGKTLVTLGMMHLYKTSGYRVAGMKPIASGARHTPRGLRNEDAERIQHQASDVMDYRLINPYAFEPAIAPHLAASTAGIRLEIDVIEACYRKLAEASDRVLVEGVGGWRVPLGTDWGVAELARMLDLPVILVVGVRLGCINHGLLSVESILGSGCRLAGWVANRVDPEMLEPEGSIETLVRLIEAPLLGEVPYLHCPDADDVAVWLRLPGKSCASL